MTGVLASTDAVWLRHADASFICWATAAGSLPQAPMNAKAAPQKSGSLSRAVILAAPAAVTLPQLVPQPLDVPGAFPDQRLMGPGHYLDRAGVRAVACHGAQLIGVCPHHVRQHVRVARVALGAGHAVAFPVPRGLQRVHREHRVPRRDQSSHPRAAVRLDPITTSISSASCPRCCPISSCSRRSRPRPPAAACGPAPGPRRPTAYVLPSQVPDLASSPRENNQRPNETVLTPCTKRARTTSQQRSILPASRQGHDLSAGLKINPGPGSAHLPAATRHRVCRMATR
jgi:hypothetical protein